MAVVVWGCSSNGAATRTRKMGKGRGPLNHFCSSSFLIELLLLFLLLLTLRGESAAAIAQSSLGGGGGGCLMSQFRCATGRCVNLNVFCDGRNDCGDNSDEPAQCTHCNRTYYAVAGESYRLLVTWPRSSNQMPFLCYLTFASATHDPNELLQVRLDSATIGQYLTVSGGSSGHPDMSGRCPDGWMQIWEGDKPPVPLQPPFRSPSATSSTTTGGGSSRQQQQQQQQQLSNGAWCGASITPRFYYTESTAVTFVLRLLSIPAVVLQQQQPTVLDLTYKVLNRSSAVVRYGNKEEEARRGGGRRVYLGEQMIGTMCSRTFFHCGNDSAVQCRLQSPGYPGIYPRNAHCLYRISSSYNVQQQQQQTKKKQQRYVVVLSQKDGRKINLRDPEHPPVPVVAATSGAQSSMRSSASSSSSSSIRSATECEASGDHITIYDGSSTLAPILARFCDGPLPQVMASGPDVTVEFRSSSCDSVYAASTTTIEGFELDVRIVAVDVATVSSAIAVSSTDEAGKCQWNVTSSGLSRGTLTSNQQTWPHKTMCHFRFQGRSDERVWIYFAKYYFAGPWSKGGPSPSHRSNQATAQQQQQQCRNSLRIVEGDASDDGWDGTVNKSSALAARTIGLFCRDKPPPLCERHLAVFAPGKEDRPPPCLPNESFISNGSSLSVQQHLPDGTAFTPWKFVLVYEFFRPSESQSDEEEVTGTSTSLGGGASACDRMFTAMNYADMRGHVKSPLNVFLFGRGGARNLRCVYRFRGDETMRVAIEVTRLRLGRRNCRSELDPLTHQRQCNNSGSGSTAFLQLQERPWGQQQGSEGGREENDNVLLIQRDCLCDTSLLPFRYVSTGSDVEVVLQVNDMSSSEDYLDFFFEIAYEFLPDMKCASQSLLKPIQGPGGVITLDGLRGSKGASSSSSSSGGSTCNRQTWFLQPRPDRFIFLSTAGFVMNETTATDCATRNRILLYSAGQRTVICPMPVADVVTMGPSADVKIFTPTHVSSSSTSQGGRSASGWWTTDAETGETFLRTNRFGSSYSSITLSTSSSSSSSSSDAAALVVEFIAIQSGSYKVKWLELTPQAASSGGSVGPPFGWPVSSPASPSQHPQPPWLCSTWCPELKACVDPQMWCDGVYDCPSGLDESAEQCNQQSVVTGGRGAFWIIPKIYWYLVAAGSTLLVFFVIVSSVLVCRNSRPPPLQPPTAAMSSTSGRSYELCSNGGGGGEGGGSVSMSSSIANTTATSLGSFRALPLQQQQQQQQQLLHTHGSMVALNDNVYPRGGHLVETSFYDKKLAVS